MSDHGDPLGKWIVTRCPARSAGKSDDVGPPRRHTEDLLTATGDQDRHAGQLTPEIRGDVFQVADATRRGGERKLSGLELLTHVTGTKAEFQPSARQPVGRAGIAGEQGRLVEPRIEHIGAQPQRRRLGGGDQQRQRCRGVEVVANEQNIESQSLEPDGGFGQRGP